MVSLVESNARTFEGREKSSPDLKLSFLNLYLSGWMLPLYFLLLICLRFLIVVCFALIVGLSFSNMFERHILCTWVASFIIYLMKYFVIKKKCLLFSMPVMIHILLVCVSIKGLTLLIAMMGLVKFVVLEYKMYITSHVPNKHLLVN